MRRGAAPSRENACASVSRPDRIVGVHVDPSVGVERRADGLVTGGHHRHHAGRAIEQAVASARARIPPSSRCRWPGCRCRRRCRRRAPTESPGLGGTLPTKLGRRCSPVRRGREGMQRCESWIVLHLDRISPFVGSITSHPSVCECSAPSPRGAPRALRRSPNVRRCSSSRSRAFAESPATIAERAATSVATSSSIVCGPGVGVVARRSGTTGDVAAATTLPRAARDALDAATPSRGGPRRVDVAQSSSVAPRSRDRESRPRRPCRRRSRRPARSRPSRPRPGSSSPQSVRRAPRRNPDHARRCASTGACSQSSRARRCATSSSL